LGVFGGLILLNYSKSGRSGFYLLVPILFLIGNSSSIACVNLFVQLWCLLWLCNIFSGFGNEKHSYIIEEN